jgi:hypothetical protein
VKKPLNLCAPAGKNGEGIGDPKTHFQGYQPALTKGQCAVDAPANAGVGCTRKTECGGTRGATSFCVTQAKSVKHTNIKVINQFDAYDSPLRVDASSPTASSGQRPRVPSSPPSYPRLTAWTISSATGPRCQGRTAV